MLQKTRGMERISLIFYFLGKKCFWCEPDRETFGVNRRDARCCQNDDCVCIVSFVGKILALVMLNRMRDPIAETVLPESQCGFRRNRGTTDMIFAVRQLMEKAREQHRNLYI